MLVLIPLTKGQESFDFDADQHPRAPKGGGHGGQFVSKADAVETFPVQYRRHGQPTPETRTVTVPPNDSPPGAAPKTSPSPLETFENPEDGVKSYVVAVPQGFSVSIQDTDTGEFLPSIPIYKTQKEASAKAKEAAFGRISKAFPLLMNRTAPLPEDTAHDSQGGPPPAKPILIPHAKRPRRRTPNRQGGGGAVLDETETDRTNLVLDPPVLIPFEGAVTKGIASGDTGPSEPDPLPPISAARTSAEEITAQNIRARVLPEIEGVIAQTPAMAVDAANDYAPTDAEVLAQAADYAATLAWMKAQTDAGYWLNVEQPVGPRENMSRFLANQQQAMEAKPAAPPQPVTPDPTPRFLVQVTVNVEPTP